MWLEMFMLVKECACIVPFSDNKVNIFSFPDINLLTFRKATKPLDDF